MLVSVLSTTSPFFHPNFSSDTCWTLVSEVWFKYYRALAEYVLNLTLSLRNCMFGLVFARYNILIRFGMRFSVSPIPIHTPVQTVRALSGVKRPQHVADYLRICNSGFQKNWRYTSSSQLCLHMGVTE